MFACEAQTELGNIDRAFPDILRTPSMRLYSYPPTIPVFCVPVTPASRAPTGPAPIFHTSHHQNPRPAWTSLRSGALTPNGGVRGNPGSYKFWFSYVNFLTIFLHRPAHVFMALFTFQWIQEGLRVWGSGSMSLSNKLFPFTISPVFGSEPAPISCSDVFFRHPSCPPNRNSSRPYPSMGASSTSAKNSI